jgi:hypothetical protein
MRTTRCHYVRNRHRRHKSKMSLLMRISDLDKRGMPACGIHMPCAWENNRRHALIPISTHFDKKTQTHALIRKHRHMLIATRLHLCAKQIHAWDSVSLFKAQSKKFNPLWFMFTGVRSESCHEPRC